MVLAHVPFAADWHTMKLKVHIQRDIRDNFFVQFNFNIALFPEDQFDGLLLSVG